MWYNSRGGPSLDDRPLPPSQHQESGQHTREFVHRVLFVHKFLGVWTEKQGRQEKGGDVCTNFLV